jgi:excisionase family DNA binding protein
VSQITRIAVTEEEAATMLSISPSTVRKLKAEGKLPRPRQIGGSARYLVRELIEAAESAPVSALLPPPRPRRAG